MNKIIFCPIFILFFFISVKSSAQEVTRDFNEMYGNDSITLHSSTSVDKLDDHSNCIHFLEILHSADDKVSGIMSLDEIISSDDLTDFRCTGGFCMNESHSHKKGLSFQKQLFNYFMKVSI